jgi:hypothetical protein
LITEYEGDQHRTDRGQWNRDIDRQEDFARDHWMLIRVTSERARWPRQVVYKALKVNGYDGPRAPIQRTLDGSLRLSAHQQPIATNWREMLLRTRRRCVLLKETPEGVGQAWQETQRLSIFRIDPDILRS